MPLTPNHKHYPIAVCGLQNPHRNVYFSLCAFSLHRQSRTTPLPRPPQEYRCKATHEATEASVAVPFCICRFIGTEVSASAAALLLPPQVNGAPLAEQCLMEWKVVSQLSSRACRALLSPKLLHRSCSVSVGRRAGTAASDEWNAARELTRQSAGMSPYAGCRYGLQIK